MPRHPVIAEDCARALDRTASLWSELRGQRIFLTGGTGFFGTWFLELLTAADDRHGLGCKVTVLTRDAAAFAAGPAGHLAVHRAVELLGGDVRTFAVPPGEFSYVAHFGSTGPRAFHDSDPEGFSDLVLSGTRRVLALAQQARTRRFLLASTGAVYRGVASPDGSGVPETHPAGPDPVSPAPPYAEAKRIAEALAVSTVQSSPGLGLAMARGFAFLGPYLPAQAGFAAVDFMNDVLAGRPIGIRGDGTPLRSYLYGADLAVWLWTLLLRAPGNTAWNVGSERAISIRDLAERMAAAKAGAVRVPVTVAIPPVPGAPVAAYVPDTSKARRELGLSETVGLDEAIRRTMIWYADQRREPGSHPSPP